MSDSNVGRAIFVVGAGRSGTSAIARALLALGVDLGDRLKAATGKNPTGFFEDEELLLCGKRARSASEESQAAQNDLWSAPGGHQRDLVREH